MKDRQKRLWARRSTSFLSCLFFPSARYHLSIKPRRGERQIRRNAVIEADWQDTPEGLLELLLDTEKAFGRRRMMRWGPRTLDLDLLYGENVEKQTEFLKLPHPFLWERLFVLVPFAEIMPCFIFKGQDIQSRIRELGGDKEIVKQEITGKGAYPWQTK